MYYDIHCHLFNKDFLRKEILYRVMLELKKLIVPRSADNKRGVVSDLTEVYNQVRRLKSFLETGFGDSSTELYQELISAYDADTVVVPLMFDLTWCFTADNSRAKAKSLTVEDHITADLDKLRKSYATKAAKLRSQDDSIIRLEDLELEIAGLFELINKPVAQTRSRAIADEYSDLADMPTSWAGFGEQIVQLKELCEMPGMTDKVLPFLAVDPRREGIIEFAQKHVGKDKLFKGIKLYTPNGYSPTDPLLYGNEGERDGLYAWCEDNHIPVTVHNSDSGFATFAKQVLINGHIWLDGNIIMINNQYLQFDYKWTAVTRFVGERAKKLNHPELWALVAKKYPDLHLNLAHFGGSKALNEALKHPLDHSLWSNAIISLIANPDYQVYTDLSCIGAKNKDVIKNLIADPRCDTFKHRIMYGSDFYLCKMFHDDLAQTYNTFKEVFGEEFDKIGRENGERFLCM